MFYYNQAMIDSFLQFPRLCLMASCSLFSHVLSCSLANSGNRVFVLFFTSRNEIEQLIGSHFSLLGFTCRGRSAATQLAQLKDFSAGVHLAGPLAPCQLQRGPKPVRGHREPSSLTPYIRIPHLNHPAASAFLESFAHPPRTPLVPPCPLPLLPLLSVLNSSPVPGKVGILI